MTTVTQTRKSTSKTTHSGTIQFYDCQKGFGYIIPDDPTERGHPLPMKRQCLRNPSINRSLKPGQKVLFTTLQDSRGVIASDVRPEVDDRQSNLHSRGRLLGIIDSVRENKGYGFIKSQDGRKVFFHKSNTGSSQTLYPKHTRVHFDIIKSSKGWNALNVSRVEPDESEQKQSASSSANQEILAQAVLAREEEQFDRARELYRIGMKSEASVQLVLSYAAFEKSQNDKKAALAVYRKGITQFPSVAKLREDAGVLAGQMGRTIEAVKFLLSALELCRNSNQAGEIGVLFALARIHETQNTSGSLRSSLEFYKKALELQSAKSIPDHDLLRMRTIQIRLQHHRGNLAYGFLHKCGFDITDAYLLPNQATGGDFLVRIDDQEMRDSYGISGIVLVRCMFKSKFDKDDLYYLDLTIDQFVESEHITDRMALLVLSSVPDDLKKSMFRRIERRQSAPLVIPIAQEVMEIQNDDREPTNGGNFQNLRGVLDTWLYRRDLFAHSYPVFGKRFFGRNRILAELRDSIVSAQASGIFGLRKVGKTSLLKECQRRAIATGDVVVYVDLLRVPAGVNDARWLYWRIANLLHEHEQVHNQLKTPIRWRLGGQFQDYLDLPDGFPVPVGFDADLSALIRSIRNARTSVRPKVVILLDEIERILPTELGDTRINGFFQFLSYLRGIAQESQDLAIIVTGANPSIVEISQFDGRDNPAFNFFKQIYLQLLEQSETRLMIQSLGKGMGIKFTDPACAYVFRLTGGHPYFAREFCSFLARRYRERPLQVTIDKVRDVIEPYLELNGSKNFQEIVDRLDRDFPSEKQICIRLAKGMKVSSTRGKLKHLIGYQLVRMVDNHPVLTMELFKRWILEWF